MCAKSEYRNLSRYYSTDSATAPVYFDESGTVNTPLDYTRHKIIIMYVTNKKYS